MTGGIVDVGSNTIRLLVARRERDGLVSVCTEGVRVGLGREIEERGRISEVKLAAAAKAVRKLCTLARERGAEHVEVLVTAPGRQSRNADELLSALERAAKSPVQVVSAEEEAALAFSGAVSAAGPLDGLVSVCDLGGASTELAVGLSRGEPAWIRSVDLGALRLTVRRLPDERPSPSELAAARREVELAFAGLAPPLPHAALAVGGTARALRKIVGSTLGADELALAVLELSSRPHAAIARRYGVDRRRAPLLLAGALILSEIQRRVVVPLEVVGAGLREGALLRSLDAVAA
jgi:exopolyphosphatase/guanosine-5'-triphosphate,3'-diphosphate pyrophosphatase